MVPPDILSFDPSPYRFPPPRLPVFPGPPVSLSLLPQASAPWDSPAHFRRYSRARYALSDAFRLAGVGPGTTVLAPSYHCRTMLDPVLALGGDVVLYPLKPDLTFSLADLERLAAQSTTPVRAVLATHFFGIPVDLGPLAAWCTAHDIVLVEDCSHAFLSEHFRPVGTGNAGDFVVSSLYKFFPCPDGGLLYSRQLERMTVPQPVPQPSGNELRAIRRIVAHTMSGAQTRRRTGINWPIVAAAPQEYFPDSDVHLPFQLSPAYRRADEHFAPLRVSEFIRRHTRINEIVRCRRDNYRTLAQALASLAGGRPLIPALPEECVPYMLPLYIDQPNPHFFHLKHLGVPVWRWDSLATSDCPTAADYRLHLLQIPCHQSLGQNDLAQMIDALYAVLGRRAKEAVQ